MTRTAADTAALADLARTPHLLVALDFDGTLSPLHDEPMAARMLPEGRAALDALLGAPETTVAFVSGRALDDLKVITEYAPDSRIVLAGSHGVEYLIPGETSAAGDEDQDADIALREEVRPAAVALVENVDGAWIEPKAYGFGLHTRLASTSDATRAIEAVEALMAERAPHWRRRIGHNILEFAFRHEGKDSAVAALRSRVGATGVLFAGDDVTDEDAIASLGDGDLGVRVGSGESAASVRVDDPADMAALLFELAKLRSAALREA